ncbi:hypothetical protein HYH03_018715 [Edaphochlamys debaryana]|uniref:E3 ubiquitin-protein ligase CHFR n=1 Tax=Edaphochlamys debaryana TaxID=47281 RepID=A0A836BMV7_9CHLO|nr:hypothetical protein HYH03_018715 [Edaphochlamys debaryana]|eukprot:KAG2482365.1 hypothetical protein HYH03_018715 [Edaphochlamys debaryana]
MIQPDGGLVLRDLNSTNGTYVAREGDFLRRLRQDESWELRRGDLIGFGGPETIVARSETPDITVANPFLFRYTPLDDDTDSGDDSVVEAKLPLAGQHARARKHSEMERGDQDMDCEEASTSSGDKDAKKAKTGVTTAKDVAQLLSNHLTCSICHDWLAGAHTLSCGHMFCGICLASWLSQKQTCPECRKPNASVPVRCRGVDNTVSDILNHNLVSPNTKRERRRKQLAWDEVGAGVVESWTQAMAQRRQQAMSNAQQHLSNLTAAPGGVAAPMAMPVAQQHRAGEHAPVGHFTRRANQGGAGPAARR